MTMENSLHTIKLIFKAVAPHLNIQYLNEDGDININI